MMILQEIGVNMKNWFDLSLDSDYSRVVINATLNHRVSKAMG